MVSYINNFSDIEAFGWEKYHKRPFNVIYRFSSISKSTRAIFKFQKLRSLLEIAQNILIVHHIDQ